ncbi:hypothetical protein J1N35_037115 [Gossypium stocksii]|uniref:Uncharacterized protein n=1 Tax=Gossypium stocksii TaxID=47602 RepID=A0A9D3UJK2_9ROSI|nr:hypothetical protein J1N35_037115 [Gossypium stocksii]
MQENALKSSVNIPQLEADDGDGSWTKADRNTKKVYFKEGIDKEVTDMLVESGLSLGVSWKDKLLGIKSGVFDKEKLGPSSADNDEDLEFLEGGVHRSIVNGIPAIDFSERI